MVEVIFFVSYLVIFIVTLMCFSEREPQILDYRTQQYKLIPTIAASIAMFFSADWLWNMYNNVTHELEEGNMERLPEVILLLIIMFQK